MILCPFCKYKSKTVKKFSIHFKLRHRYNLSNICCKQRKCTRIFTNVYSYRKHLILKHLNNSNEKNVKKTETLTNNYINKNNKPTTSSCGSCNVNHNEEGGGVSNIDFLKASAFRYRSKNDLFQDFTNSLKSSTVSLAAKLYSNYSFARSTVQEIITEIENLYNEPLEIVEEIILSQDSKDRELIKNMLSLLKNPFKELKTEYLRFKFFKNSNFFVEVESLHLGEKIVDKKVHDQVVLHSMEAHVQYVPIKKTLKLFLEIPNIYKDIQDYVVKLCNRVEIRNVMQGELWHNIKYNVKKNILPLYLYFDDFEVGNPLGSHAGKNKIGALYFSLACLPPECSSQLDSIFLALLHYSEYRKVFGNASVFKKVIEDLQDLFENGITIATTEGSQQIYFIVISVLGDNLGIHSLMGFNESFVSNNYCQFCLSDKNSCRVQVTEDLNLLRNIDNYQKDLVNFNNGIKEECIWNNLPRFHVTNNLSCDVMHDIHEGVSRYDLGEILYQFVFIKKYFTLDILNNRIKYFNFNSNDNKPPPLTKQRLSNKYIIMSASEMKTLTSYLGLIIGDLVPQNCEYWQLYLLLCKIIEIVDSKVVTFQESYLLQNIISEHHELYIEKFGYLKPKHHFLVHYPRLMRMLGPLSNTSSIRYEARHRQFKSAANVIASRKNIPYSLAIKNQLSFCNRVLSNKGLFKTIDYGPQNVTLVEENLCFSFFKNKFPQKAENCFLTDWVEIHGVKYTHNLVLLLKISNFLPCFGKISLIVLSEENVYFICKTLSTIKLDVHYNAYEANDDDNDDVVCVDYNELQVFKTHLIHLMPNGLKYVNVL